MQKEIITFGCRLNHYESEIIRDHADSITDDEQIFIFNTCAVTKEAERQARQAIRKKRKQYPNSKIIVTGCAAQINPDGFSAMGEIDQIIGNDLKLQKKTYLDFDSNISERVLVNDIFSIEETASHMVQGLENHARAFMQVQNGCDHRCTFCIIPYGRGNSRSVPVGEVIRQAQILVENGYNEIVLTGVDLTSYGNDLPGKPSLGQLAKRLLKMLPDLPRLRLSSVDVAEIDEDLWTLIASEPRFMPYMHLSLQSGDNMILKRMKRRHSREQALEFCEKAKDIRPDISFGADIISGFPTETDDMFENSLSFIKEANLVYLHIFPYSEREGTPASRIPQNKHVPMKIRKERANMLRKAGIENLNNFLDSNIGNILEVVVEKTGITGRSEQFCEVSWDQSQKCKTGSLQKIKITHREDQSLIGNLI